VKPRPAGTRAWGIFHPNAPEDPGQLDRLIEAIGAAPRIVMWYQHWGLDATRQFNPATLATVRDRGGVPLITWEPWNPQDPGDKRFRLQRLLTGAHDDYIRGWARGLKAHDGPVMLRWGHEMNGFWYPWAAQWGAKPTDPPNEERANQYIRSWAHIRGIFDTVYDGAPSNVSWVWCPNIDFTGATPFSMIYPGAASVDWVGLDGYNWYGEQAWRTFPQIFGSSLQELRRIAPAKRVMIGEVASNEDPVKNGRKAAWIRSTYLEVIPRDYPEIEAVIWFDQDKERPWAVTPWWPTEGWSDARRVQSLKAFKEVARSVTWAGTPGLRSGRTRP
jgi:hypothetical protein